MGQKAHPKGLRLGYIVDWQSRWFSPRQMPGLIGEDFKIRALIRNAFRQAAVSSVVIERAGSYLRVNIHTARPGVVIGKRGADIESLRAQIETLTARKTFVNVMEIKEPELDAKLVAEAIAAQVEKRVAYRRAMRRAMERTMQSGALGVKVRVGGRLNGSEIARTEWLREGRVPLHTYSADIDYGTAEAMTTAGLIGVKVWIFRKLLFVKNPKELLKLVKKDVPVLTASDGKTEVVAPIPTIIANPAREEVPDANA
ncbi:MAG: 30S ribosomal protein S3 [Elusimicrobiota bacterium]